MSLILVSFVTGFLVSPLKGALVKGDTISVNKVSQEGKPISQGGYAYINPLLECEIGANRISKYITPFRHKIKEYISQQSEIGKVYDISVYFQDLNNGTQFDVNARTKFTPASLLKLPLLIAYYKNAEQHKNLLEQKITYTGDTFEQMIKQKVLPTTSLKQGETYTIDDLIRKMIIHSDNHAMLLLFSQVDQVFYNSVYRDLGIAVPDLRDSEDFMSIKEYSRFFGILFNASYLSKEFSDRALRLLTEVEFSDGLKKGIPGNIKIAHKFGEHSIEGDMTKQFHDCGIVYYSKPYLLCVMTRGEDADAQMNVIAGISRLVYEEMDSNLSKY